MADEFQINGVTFAEDDNGNSSIDIEELNTTVNVNSLVRNGKATDVLDAIEYAQTEIFGPEGGVVKLERGRHQASTPITIDKPIRVGVDGGAAVDSGTEPLATSIVEWTGGAGTPITCKKTADTPSAEAGGWHFGPVAIVPDTVGEGTHGIYFDASTDAIRGVTLDHTVVQGFGGAGVRVSGNVFNMQTYSLGLQGNGQNGNYYDYHEDDGGNTSPERVHHYAPFWIAGGTGVGAARLNAIDTALFGGNVQDTSGNGLEGVRVTGAGSGVIESTHIEGKGGVGQAIVVESANTGPLRIRPSRVFNWDIGVQLGVGNDASIRTPVIGTKFAQISTWGVTYNDSFGLSGLRVKALNGDAEIDWGSIPFDSGPVDTRPGGVDSTYTGDGTNDNSKVVDPGTYYRAVLVSDGTNTVLAVRGTNGTYTIVLEGSMGGDVSLSGSGGFAVSDGGSDAFPNKNGTTYEYIKLA